MTHVSSMKLKALRFFLHKSLLKRFHYFFISIIDCAFYSNFNQISKCFHKLCQHKQPTIHKITMKYENIFDKANLISSSISFFIEIFYKTHLKLICIKLNPYFQRFLFLIFIEFLEFNNLFSI
jgi:hypothetical protein